MSISNKAQSVVTISTRQRRRSGVARGAWPTIGCDASVARGPACPPSDATIGRATSSLDAEKVLLSMVERQAVLTHRLRDDWIDAAT